VIDPLILARGVHIAATVLAGGAVCFLVLVAEPAARRARAARPVDLVPLRRRLTLAVWTALAVAILSGVGWLVLLAADLYGAPVLEVCLNGGVWSVLTETRFGQVAGARLALALLLGLLILWPATRLPQLAAAAGLIVLLALIGHAGATPGPAGRVHLASDTVHLLAAGAWVGGLPALALLLSHARRAANPAWNAVTTVATNRFSLLGIACVGALLASGSINSWNLLAGPRDLVATDFGRLVLLKIGLFAAMVVIAAVNRFHLTPRLAAPTALRALQRNSLAEIGLGLCVLLLVGALGTMAPTAHEHVHAPSAEIPPDAAFVHIHSSEAMAEVTIAPGHAGPARASIRLTREDSSIFAAAEVMLVLTPQAQAGAPPLSRAATRLSDGTWQVDGLEIGQPGIWIVKLTVTPGTGAPFVLDAPVVIDR
jgi:putative copper resistance protein D